jgi:hypothetical protein
VPADEDEGAGGHVHYVTVEQDPDQSIEVGVPACADKRKPLFNHLTHVFTFKFWIYYCYLMCIYIQELIETLVAWSISTYYLLLACQVASAML